MSTIRDTLLKLMSEVTDETAKRLEKILADTPNFSKTDVQAAFIAAQAQEINILKHENERLQKAHDHQYSMAGQMLREAERAGAERDALKQELTDKHNALIRFQDIARATDRALVSIVDKVRPDIEAIRDGCIKIHLRQVLNLINPEERDAQKAEVEKLRDFKKLVHAWLDKLNIPTFENDPCRIGLRLRTVEENRLIPEGATCWNPEDSFHKLCIAACLEANRARGLYQKPDHLALALAEEAGEVTKAVLDHKQGKCDLAGVRKEIVQTMAMCLRLATEGDPTVDLKRSQE